MSNKINMTEAQIERQGKKIMEILFTEIVAETDSGYTAEINAKVIDLFKSEIPFNEALEESELGDILIRLIKKICDFVFVIIVITINFNKSFNFTYQGSCHTFVCFYPKTIKKNYCNY